MYDILFKNAILVDGTGEQKRKADVAISGQKIEEIDTQINKDAKEVIDVEGKILAPGFIDVHSHSDISLLHDNNPGGKIYQGITTEVVGNCGFSPFPLKGNPEFITQRRNSLSFIDVEEVDWEWRDYSQYRKKLEEQQPNVNIVSLIGHGSIRAMVMGYSEEKASPQQLEEMGQLLQNAFDQGIVGISTGLGYAPDFYGDEKELISLAKVVAKNNKIFTFHIRGERGTLVKAINEVIAVAMKSKAKVEISHLKCAGLHNKGRSTEILGLIHKAVEDGADISFDMYPYMAGSSYLGLVFPPWVHEGGMDALLKRLENTELLPDILNQMENGTEDWGTFIGEFNGENLHITSLNVHQNLIGKTIKEIANNWNCTPSEAAVRLMVEEGGKVEMVMFLTQEEDMDNIALDPLCLYGTDGLAMDYQKTPIRQRPHPRYYGSMPTIINRYVKTNKMTIENAIHKLTLAATKRFGIEKRGAIKEGCYADLVVFDMDQISSISTYENPHHLSGGIAHLVVNGSMLIKDGQKMQKTAGKVL